MRYHLYPLAIALSLSVATAALAQSSGGAGGASTGAAGAGSSGVAAPATPPSSISPRTGERLAELLLACLFSRHSWRSVPPKLDTLKRGELVCVYQPFSSRWPMIFSRSASLSSPSRSSRYTR
jgi:hypothetical protein